MHIMHMYNIVVICIIHDCVYNLFYNIVNVNKKEGATGTTAGKGTHGKIYILRCIHLVMSTL